MKRCTKTCDKTMSGKHLFYPEEQAIGYGPGAIIIVSDACSGGGGAGISNTYIQYKKCIACSMIDDRPKKEKT